MTFTAHSVTALRPNCQKPEPERRTNLAYPALHERLPLNELPAVLDIEMAFERLSYASALKGIDGCVIILSDRCYTADGCSTVSSFYCKIIFIGEDDAQTRCRRLLREQVETTLAIT